MKFELQNVYIFKFFCTRGFLPEGGGFQPYLGGVDNLNTFLPGRMHMVPDPWSSSRGEMSFL